MPEIAPLRGGFLRTRSSKPRDDPGGVGRPDVLPAEARATRRRNPSFKSRIRELAVAAADEEPAVGVAERRGTAPRVGLHAIETGPAPVGPPPRTVRQCRPRVEGQRACLAAWHGQRRLDRRLRHRLKRARRARRRRPRSRRPAPTCRARQRPPDRAPRRPASAASRARRTRRNDRSPAASSASATTLRRRRPSNVPGRSAEPRPAETRRPRDRSSPRARWRPGLGRRAARWRRAPAAPPRAGAFPRAMSPMRITG